MHGNITLLADVPDDSCFHRVITALRYELKCSCLARKVVKCYGETQGKGAELQYRFTGKGVSNVLSKFHEGN